MCGLGKLIYEELVARFFFAITIKGYVVVFFSVYIEMNDFEMYK